jgi:hypothetical protein
MLETYQKQGVQMKSHTELALIVVQRVAAKRAISDEDANMMICRLATPAVVATSVYSGKHPDIHCLAWAFIMVGLEVLNGQCGPHSNSTVEQLEIAEKLAIDGKLFRFLQGLKGAN